MPQSPLPPRSRLRSLTTSTTTPRTAAATATAGVPSRQPQHEEGIKEGGEISVMRDGNGHNGAAEVQRGLPAENENSGNQKGSRRDSPSSPQQQRRRHPCAVSIIASAESTSPISREDKRGNAALPSADAGTAQVDLRISTVSRNKSAADPASVSLLGLSPLPATSVTDSSGPSSSLLPFTSSASHEPLSSMLSGLPCMQRVRGPTSCVNTIDAANAAAAEQSAQVSSVSLSGDLVERQTSSAAATGTSATPPTTAIMSLCSPPSISASSIIVTDLLSPVSYARQRRNAAMSTMRSEEESTDEQQKRMSRRATVPIMSLASTLCRSFYDNDCPARASPSSANGVGATDTTTAATAAVTEEKDNSLSELEVTSPTTASIFTCSEFTLTSNALLHRSAAAAAAVDADGTIYNGGVVRRRRNTMATLPTQLQQQQKQEDSSTLRPPASTVFGGIMSKLATYQLHFPDYATLEDQSRPVSSQDKEQEQLTPFMLEAYRTHTGDSIMLFEASSNPSDSAKAAPPPPPPPLLSLLPPSAPLSPSSAAAVVATATATSAHKTTTDTSLLTSPPSQAALLPNRPRRSSTTLSGPGSPYHNHRSQNSATSSSGDGCRGSSRCWSTGESVLNVSDQTCELNISDGRRTHPSCGSTPSVSNGRTSVAGLTKDKNSLTRNSSRTDGAAALTTRGDVCYEMARGEGEGLPAGGSEASSSTSAASSSVLLGASSDGFADVVSTGPSLVSSLPLPSPAQSKPLSGEGSKKRSALAAVGASPVAAAGAALRTQRPSVSAVTGSTTSAVSMLTDTTPPSTRSGKLHGHNCSSTNDEDSSALLCNVTPPSRARVQDEAQRPQQQQQQQHRLSQAPAYTLSSLSSAPSKSVSNEAVTPCQPRTPSSTAIPSAQAVAQTDAIPEESRRPSPSNNIAGSPSRRGQNAERCGGRGHGYTTSTMKLQNQLTPASDHTVSAPDTTALRSSTLHSPRETTSMPAGKKQDRGTSRIDSHPSSSSSASTHSSSSSPSSRARLSADVLTPLHDSATFPDTATCKRRASSARTHVKDGTEDDEGDSDGNAGGGEGACALPQQQQQSCALRMPLMQFAPQYSTPPHADAAVVAPTAPPPHYPSNPPPTLSQLRQQPQPQQQRHERNSPIHTSGVVQYPSKSLASSPDTAADGSICIELTQQQADGGGVPYPCRDAQRAVASSPLELGNVVAAGRRSSSSSASPVASENPLPSLSTIATVITPLRSVNATTAAAAACGGASNATRQASTTTVKSSNTSPLPRGPSTTSGVAGAGDAPPVRFKSVAGSSGGASPLVRSTEATPPPPPRSASGSTAMATPCHNNNNNNSNGSLQRPPSSDASFSLAMTTTVTVTSATGRPTAVAAGSNNSHNNASSASVMNCRRASPVFTGFGFATQTTSNNARTASIPTSTSLSLPPHVRSSSSSNAPPVVVPQSLTTTSQLLTHHSMGSISSTSSMGAFILQGNSTAMMMRRGIPHKMTEVSLPDQSGSYRGVSTSTGNGDDENGSYDKEDNINGEDDDLTSSATYRRSRRAACLSKRGAIGGIKSASHSRRGVARSAGKCRRHSLLKPGTAIELAILNGACTRRPSAVSLLHGGGVGGGGWSIMGRSGMHSAAQHQQELAWPDGEPLEVSLSCAMSFTASSTSASESYISSSYGSLSQAVLKYRPLTAMGASSEGEKNDTSGARSHTSLRQTCFAVPASSSSLSFPSGASGEVKKTRNAEKHDAGAVEDSCVLYAAAPVHFHFYRTVKSHDDDDDEPHQQSYSAPLQLPRYERPQLNPASLQSSPSAWWESASPAAATTAAAPNAAAAAVPQVVTRQREKRHHRYVRVHHRRCTEATPLAHDRNFKISPPPPPEKDVIEPLQPPSSLLREPKSEESSDSDKKTSTAAGSEDVSLVRQDSDKIGHRDLSPPSAAAATTPRKASTPPQQSTPPPRAIYSPHLSTSSLLYYDDVDSDAVDDVYYQLEKRLFPVKAEEELQRRYSLCDVSQSSQEIRDLAGGQDGNENHTADQVGSEANTLDALFTVLDVPLRLNLRGGFHLSDYYAPCPICHPVMRKLAATAAAAAATSTTSTTVSTTISDASDVCSCSQCSCTSSASSSSSSRSSSCDSDGNNINANHCQGHHGSSRSENCSSSTGSSHSSTTSDASVVSSPSSASSTAYTASTPSAGSVLSSVISTTGIGFTFGSGTRLGSAASPLAHRLPSPSNNNSPSSRATASNAAAAAAAATATANAKVGSTRPCGYSGRRNACHSSSAVVAAAGGVSYTSNIKNNNNNGCGGSRVNNVRVVSPKDADDHFLVAVPSPCSANDSSTAPSRHRADRDDSSRSIGHADRDAPMPATASTPRATPSSSAVTGASAAAATAAAAPGADRSSSSKLVTTSNNNNSDTTSNTVCTSQPLSSILQRGVSTTSGTLRNATAPLSATKTTASDAPVPPQQQQHSLSSFPPFGHGQLPAFTSTPHSFRSGQVVPISQPMAFTSTRRDSRSLTAGGGATHCRVTSAMSAPHLARYRRVRQRHRPALIVARRRGYYGAGGHTQYSQYSGLMKQRLLCIRVNDKFTYIDPKRATGAAKLVADAALLAERQKRAKEKRQRVQAEEAARKWEATPAAAAADLNEIAEGAPLNVKKTAAAVGEGAAARSYCRHCHRLRRLPRHHRHHHNQQYNPAITENGEKQGDAARTDERTTPASHHHRHHRHHSHHHRRSKGGGSDNGSDLLSQNVGAPWEVHGILPTPRNTTAATGAAGNLERDVNEESIQSSSAYGTPQQQRQQQRQRQRQHHLFGDGLACFAAHQSPVPKGPIPARIPAEGAFATVLRRLDTTTSSRSGPPCGHVVAHESPPRQQQQQQQQRAAFISRTAGRVLHQRVYSSSSCRSPSSSRASAVGATGGVAAAPSSLQGSVSIVSRLRSSSSGSDTNEVPERREQSTLGTNASSDHVNSVGDVLTQPTAAATGAAAMTTMLRAADGTVLPLHSQSSHHSSSGGSPLAPPAFESSHGHPTTPQQSDSALWSVGASVERLMTANSGQVSEDVVAMPVAAVDEAERRSELSLSRLPHPTTSPPAHGLCDGSRAHKSGGAFGMGGVSASAESKSQSASVNNARSSGGNAYGRLSYHGEERDAQRIGLAPAPTSLPDMAEMPYSVGSHNLQLHFLNSGRSSSAFSTPTPACPLSLNNNNNNHHSISMTAFVTTPAAAMNPPAPAEESSGAATAGTVEGRQGSHNVQRSTASSTCVTPFNVSAGPVNTTYNIPSRSTSQSGTLVHDNSGVTPLRGQNDPRRSHSGRGRGRSHSRPAQYHRSLASGSSHCHHRHMHLHHRGLSLMSTPLEAETTEADLLNTALAAYPEFASRSESRSQPRRQQP